MLWFAPTEIIDFMSKKSDKWQQPTMEPDEVRQKGLVSSSKRGFYWNDSENEGRV